MFSTGSAVAARFGITLTPEDTAMESLMHACWVAFAKTGKPECGGQSWPAYTPANDTLMEFGPKSGLVSGFRKGQYDALDTVLRPN